MKVYFDLKILKMDLEKFKNENFDSNVFTNNIVKEMITGSELGEFKQQLNQQKELISESLKQKIYKNYIQFIETSSEISRKIANSLCSLSLLYIKSLPF